MTTGARQGAVAGLVAGIGIVVLFTAKPEWSFGITKVIHVSAVGAGMNAFIFAIVSRFTEKLPQKRIDEFRQIMKGKG